jgi:hypothetical protein
LVHGIPGRVEKAETLKERVTAREDSIHFRKGVGARPFEKDLRHRAQAEGERGSAKPIPRYSRGS